MRSLEQHIATEFFGAATTESSGKTSATPCATATRFLRWLLDVYGLRLGLRIVLTRLLVRLLRRRRIVSALLGRTTVSALLGVAAAVLLAVGLLSVKVASKKTDEEK